MAQWNNLTNEKRRAIYRRDGYQCALCGSTKYLQIHHIERRGAGGSNDARNLITLCSTCHGEAHGVKPYPGAWNEEDIYQCCIEYIADYYAYDDYPCEEIAATPEVFFIGSGEP